VYKSIGKECSSHESFAHSLYEYVLGYVHTQVVKNYFSIQKRGLVGVDQYCSTQHLKRYICEFDFRYNHHPKLGINGTGRILAGLKGIIGKRLTYSRTGERM
jgi:hypothetical protein